jgi:hypothetical protein
MPDGLTRYPDMFVSNALKEDQRSYVQRTPLLCLLMGEKGFRPGRLELQTQATVAPAPARCAQIKGANP